MWLMTDIGFYSAVEHRDDDTLVMVRARARADLERLIELLERDTAPEIIEGIKGADYPARIVLAKAEWAKVVERLAWDIDYDNFKNAVGQRCGYERAGTYSAVWGRLLAIEREGREGVESDGFQMEWDWPVLDREPHGFAMCDGCGDEIDTTDPDAVIDNGTEWCGDCVRLGNREPKG